MASIRNNCNVFTCVRLTDLSCNVAVLTLHFSLVVSTTLLRRLAGNMRGRYSQSSFYETASPTIHHTVHPYHGHWGEVIFSYSRQKSNWCYQYICSVQSAVVTTSRIWHCREDLEFLSHIVIYSLIYRSAMFCIFCVSHKKNHSFSHLSWICVHLETQIQTFLLFSSLIIPNIRHTRCNVMFIGVIDWSYSNTDSHVKYPRSSCGNVACP